MNPPHDLTRRDLFQQVGLGLLGAAVLPAAAAAAPGSSPSAIPMSRSSHNRFPRMVHDQAVGLVREAERLANQRRAALRTRQDAEAYVADVRRKIQQSFGPWPEKTPLQAQTTGRLERDAYVIEKVTFESRPGFVVTANLYLPKGSGGRRPAVIGACGHLPLAKADPEYQSFAQGLARFGYVTLIFDPLGQGERLQYPDAHLQSQLGDNGVMEHLMAGNQQRLVGESLATWRAWDGIRALDYLLTRPEVDPARVGVTGNSGGGTDTTWLCGVEPRWSMAAPECFVTTFRRNLENEVPADSEQYPPHALALGLDHSDFIAAMAPKPVILIGQEKDFFDARALEEAYARLRRLYSLLGAEQNISLAIKSDYHAYSQPSREAMYGWFNSVTGISRDSREPALTLEKPEDLQCTSRGQVSGPGRRTVFSFTREKSLALGRERQALSPAALREAVAAALKLPPAAGVPEYRILRPEIQPVYAGKQAGTYLIETEPPAAAIVYRLSEQPLMSRPPRGEKRALLYVSHQSADDELRHDSWLGDLVRSEPAVFACDVRGSGESRPNTCDLPWDHAHGADYLYASHALMLDRPYPGQKTFDLLRVIAWMKSFGHEEIHLVAAGWGTIPGTFAALLSDEVKQVTLKSALPSYSAIAETEIYRWPLSTFLPGVLRTFDLPDCYRALQAKKLRLVEPGQV